MQTWITQSPAGQKLLEHLRIAAQTPLSLYLHGETGVGKELLAHQIHSWSQRSSGPLIALHCAALSPQIAESELFGHVRGAFTGAMKTRKGALLSAQDGTLFLDEIGELSADLQVKLLRFLENGEYRPVGSDQTEISRARIVCATHRNLTQWVSEGRFREDLYFRLAGIALKIPPLRDRREDIVAQARIFARAHGFSLAPECEALLQAQDWPGNSRELKRTVERALFMYAIPRRDAGHSAQVFAQDVELSLQKIPPRETDWNLEAMERNLILQALQAHHGNRASAAAALGIARSTLFERLKAYGVSSASDARSAHQ